MTTRLRRSDPQRAGCPSHHGQRRLRQDNGASPPLHFEAGISLVAYWPPSPTKLRGGPYCQPPALSGPKGPAIPMARAAGRAHWCDPLAGSVDMTWVELGQVQRQRQRQRQGHSRASRTPEPPPLVAWASSPRNDHSPPEQRPHNGQDARRTTGSGDRGSGSDRFSGSQQHRAPVRSRQPATDTVTRVGHGPRRCGSLGSPMHRPAVTFGARRASAPARRPAVA
jgi:hypothetical protein